jgi:hypothetical protein
MLTDHRPRQSKVREASSHYLASCKAYQAMTALECPRVRRVPLLGARNASDQRVRSPLAYRQGAREDFSEVSEILTGIGDILDKLPSPARLVTGYQKFDIFFQLRNDGPVELLAEAVIF